MELRKLIQHGPSSLTISLPSKWLKEKNLKKGDQIQIIEKNETLILNSINYNENTDEITIDISNLDRTSTVIYIQFAYRLGYKTIHIKTSNENLFHIRKNKNVNTINTIHEISKRLIGSEITNQNKNFVTITQITTENIQDLNMIERRIFLLILELNNIFLESIKNNDFEKLKIIDEKHRTINNLSNYYLRLLNIFSTKQEKKKLLNYHIIASLEKIIDIYKHNSRLILNLKPEFSKNSIEFISKSNLSIKLYYEIFYKFEQKKLSEITSIRNFLKKEIEENLKLFSKEEILILSSKKEIPEQLIDLINFPL